MTSYSVGTDPNDAQGSNTITIDAIDNPKNKQILISISFSTPLDNTYGIEWIQNGGQPEVVKMPDDIDEYGMGSQPTGNLIHAVCPGEVTSLVLDIWNADNTASVTGTKTERLGDDQCGMHISDATFLNTLEPSAGASSLTILSSDPTDDGITEYEIGSTHYFAFCIKGVGVN